MNRGATLLLAIPLLGLGPSGCLFIQASGSFGPRLDEQTIARIVPGQTTRREVLAWLGPPEEYLRSEVLESLADETTRVSGAIALGNRAQDALTWQHDTLEGRGTALLFFNRFRARVESDVLVIFFDDEDRVRELAFRRASGRR